MLFLLDFVRLTFSFLQPSWEVELSAYLATISGTTDPSVASAESNVLTKLQESLSLSASRSLDSIRECLNNLATGGLVSNENVVFLTTFLEQTQLYFDIFEKTLQADEDLKVVMAAQEAILPDLEAIKTRKEQMTNLNHQIVEF